MEGLAVMGFVLGAVGLIAFIRLEKLTNEEYEESRKKILAQ